MDAIHDLISVQIMDFLYIFAPGSSKYYVHHNVSSLQLYSCCMAKVAYIIRELYWKSIILADWHAPLVSGLHHVLSHCFQICCKFLWHTVWLTAIGFLRKHQCKVTFHEDHSNFSLGESRSFKQGSALLVRVKRFLLRCWVPFGAQAHMLAILAF